MREWLLAIFYAVLTAGALTWLGGPGTRWADFTRHVATLTPLMRLAIHVEGKLGCCALHRLWP